MEIRKIAIFVLSLFFILFFIYAGISVMIRAAASYQESRILEASGAHCLSSCGFWHFFLWPIVFIIIAALLTIFIVLWIKKIKN